MGAWSDAQHKQAREMIDSEVVQAQREALKNGTLHDGPLPLARDMFEDVYAEPPLHLKRQRQEAGI